MFVGSIRQEMRDRLRLDFVAMRPRQKFGHTGYAQVMRVEA
jgi:hypothetical protein